MIDRLLHISLNTVAAPFFPIRKGLRSIAKEYREICWTDYPSEELGKLENDTLKCVRQFKPDIIFMQLQVNGIFRDKILWEMAQNSFLISWTGDVRSDTSFYEHVGEFIGVTLFTNVTDVHKLRAKNIRADYLQVGYDHKMYKPIGDRTQRLSGIVFLGSNYDNFFPLSQFRHDMCVRMWKEFSAGRATPGFNFYGNGWDLPVQTYMLAPHEEANCYRSCDIAINCSHFDYSRYSSDRMLRIMGCRALCMTHRFQDIEMDYKDGENVIVWNDFDDLVDKCKYWMKPEQLHQRRKIANAGYELVSKNATWSARAKELLEIVKKYR